jgi:hypothetical protein
MKKILYVFAAAVLALSSCTKGADIVGGYDYYEYTLGGQYMKHIADDLMAGALENLEIAIDLGKTEVTWASHFSGMTIQKADENVWHLSFEGPFAFDEKTYQTAFVMTATKLNEEKHADWDVTITGSRTEREGYRCTFESLGTITYKALYTEQGWDMLYGRLSMLVFNKDTKKDGCMLTFDGAPSQAHFVRGL